MTGAELGDPATDRPLTYRVHPDDDPRDPGARRVVRDDDNAAPWYLVTGPRERVDDLLTYFLTNEDVADWPYTNHALAAAAFRAEDEHRTMAYRSSTGTVCCLCGAMATARDRSEAGEWWQAHRRRQARNAVAQPAERGDLDVTAFKGGVS